MSLKSFANARNLFDATDLDEDLVREFGPQLRCFENSKNVHVHIDLDLSTEVLQLAAPHTQGDARAKYEAAYSDVKEFNAKKRWYQGSRQVDTVDLVLWTIESVVSGQANITVGSRSNPREISFVLKGEPIRAESQWYEGGSIVLTFHPDDTKSSKLTKPSRAVYDFCQAFGDFLKDALMQTQRSGVRPKFNKYPF